MNKQYPTVLSIAGSDSGGGAGIQADLKAISACGGFGMTAITALTAQNTLGVHGIHPIPVPFVAHQIKVVLEDIGAQAIKIGMLHNSTIIKAIKKQLLHFKASNMVIDPVMVATSGDKLLEDEAIDTLRQQLLPMATVITPNIPEASLLLAQPIEKIADLPLAAEALSQLTQTSVLLKGGHLKDDHVLDVFFHYESGMAHSFIHPRIQTTNTHGTGCTLSSAIATYLARAFPLYEAIKEARNYLQLALLHGAEYKLGHGAGPVNHFYGH